MTCTVTVTDWTQPRGYRNSGRGWRVRCFGLPENDFNATGRTVSESFHRTKAAADKKAEMLAREYNAKIMG